MIIGVAYKLEDRGATGHVLLVEAGSVGPLARVPHAAGQGYKPVHVRLCVAALC